MKAEKRRVQILIVVEGDGWDSADYAREFEDFFISLGVEAPRAPLSGKHMGDDYRRGVWLRWSTVLEKERAFPRGQTLIDALTACGIDVTADDHPDWAFYELVIGARRA